MNLIVFLDGQTYNIQNLIKHEISYYVTLHKKTLHKVLEIQAKIVIHGDGYQFLLWYRLIEESFRYTKICYVVPRMLYLPSYGLKKSGKELHGASAHDKEPLQLDKATFQLNTLFLGLTDPTLEKTFVNF